MERTARNTARRAAKNLNLTSLKFNARSVEMSEEDWDKFSEGAEGHWDAYRSGCGTWVASPSTDGRTMDWNDTASSLHY